MVDYAKAEFRRPDDATIEQLPEPALFYIWQWFCELADWRDSGMGIGPLLHQEIESWARLFRLDIGPSEVEALRQIDREFRTYHNDRNKKEEDKPQSLSEGLRALKQQSQEKPKPPPKRAKKSNG